MKTTLRDAALVLCLAAPLLQAQVIAPSDPDAQPAPAAAPAADLAAPAALPSRWELGTRITYYDFRTNRKGEKFKGSFLGSLYEIKEDQDYSPTKVFAQYFFTPFLGVGAAYEHVEAYTWDGGGTDGTVELDGALLYAVGRLPDYDLVRPFAEIGVAFFSASFDYDPEWYDDGIHIMDLEDSFGITLALGADLLLSDRWVINGIVRYTTAAVDATVYTTDIKTEDGTFEMDHFSIGLGLKAAF